MWLWQLLAKMDPKVVCRSLETGKRYRCLVQKEIEAVEAHLSSAYNAYSSKGIRLMR